MTDNVFDPVIYHFVRHRDRLFRVTGIVIFYDLQLFALDAALSINVCNRLFRARKFWSPYCATGPDIAPTTATLISACAIVLNANAIHPASNALPFMFILRFPIIMVITIVVMLLCSALFQL